MNKALINALTFLFAFTIIFSSCKKSDNPTPQTTELEITVVNELGELQSDATVKIYRTSSDWSGNINVFSTQTTNSEGKVNFKNLESIKYYFDVIKGNMDNYPANYYLQAPATKNKKTSITVMIN